MRHGRARIEMQMNRDEQGMVTRAGLVGLFSLVFAHVCLAQQTQPENIEKLRMTWVGEDHPSGVYYPESAGKLTVAVENPTDGELPLKGSIAFGMRGQTAKDFKAISITPITETTLGPGQRAAL